MKHPFSIRAGHWTYEALCNKVRAFYGVSDAELFFASIVRRIKDKCLRDPMRLAQYRTLAEWHEAMALKYKYTHVCIGTDGADVVDCAYDYRELEEAA